MSDTSCPLLVEAELLGGCALHEVLRGRHAGTGAPVVVKHARSDHDPVAASTSIARERRILDQLQGIDGVPAILDCGPNEVVMADLGGVDLARAELAGTLEAAEVLAIAQQLARTLAAIHDRGLVHLDVHPGNVVVRREELHVELIDYSCAMTLPLSDLDHPVVSQLPHLGLVAFRAPELDGSSWSDVDHRTDLYGLGATLLYLATGEAPFVDDDVVALRHAKRTRLPASLAAVGERFPPTFARILARLVDPDPDRRYRSAGGLAHDLEALQAFGVGADAMADLPLGRHDLAPAPRSPRRLVGRTRELTALREALDDTRRGGSPTVFVAGPPGIGKTALISELRADVLASGGWFATGKFEELQRDQPLSAPVRILRDLSAQLLHGPPGHAAGWRRRLTVAVGADGHLILEAIPDLQPLLEVTGTVRVDDQLERRSRLRSALVDLVAEIAQRDAPLVLVLDDLQWADQPSVELLDELLSRSDIDGLLVIGAYRDAEVGPVHPLTALRSRLRSGGRPPRELPLGPLERPMLAELVGAMLLDDVAGDDELVDAVAARTAGNPFHAVELVLGLHRRGALVADVERGRWQLVPERMGAEQLTDDLVAMLVEELASLRDPHGALTTAACLGGGFAVALLAGLLEVDEPVVAAALEPALRRGVLRPEDPPTGEDPSAVRRLRFAHDRMREAALGLLTPADRQRRHLELAHHLGAGIGVERDVMAAAGQLVLAAPSTLPTAQVLTHVGLLRAAAATAVSAGAFPTAVRFLRLAADLLPDDAWETARDHAFGVHEELHASMCGSADHAGAETVFTVLQEHSRGAAELAAAARLHITALADQTRYEEAVRLGSRLLGDLGVEVPIDEPIGDVDRRLRGLEAEFSAHGRLYLPTAPAEADERRIAWLINRMIPVAFFWRPEVAFWLSVVAVDRWREHGLLDEYLYPAACLTLTTIGMRDDPALGSHVAFEALRLGSERPGTAPTELARTHHVVGLFVSHWSQPLERSIDHARLAFEQLARAGQTDFACFSYYTTQAAILDTANDLAEVDAEVVRARAYATRAGNLHAEQAYVSFRRTLLALRGETDRPGSFEGPGFSEADHLDAVAGNPMARSFHHTYRAITALLFGDRDTLLREAAAARAHAPFITGFWPSALVRVVSAMASVEILRQGGVDPDVATPARAQLDDDERWLQGRAAASRTNLGHLAELVAAERAELDGDRWNASVAFERAAELAAAHHRPWQLALILERAAAFHRREGLVRGADALLLRARLVWQRLGAGGKVAAMDLDAPHLAHLEAGRSSGGDQDVDHVALLRAVRSISGVRTRAELVARIVQVVGPLAGASHLRLLARAPGGDWWLEGGIDGEEPLSRRPLGEAVAAAEVPASILEVAARATDLLVSEDASTDPRFASDPRYQRTGRSSLLVLPIRGQGELEAVLVLEDHQRRSAFGSTRLELLTLLASQLASEFESLTVREHLEELVDERTRALEQANERLDDLSRTDALTGIGNRRQLDAVLSSEWRRAARSSRAVGLLLLDLDHFKDFNDRLGHQAGDLALQAVAGVLRDGCRRATETVTRFGGEEFAIVVADAEVPAVLRLAEQLRAGVRELALPGMETITVSIGVAVKTADAPGSTERELLYAADMALYRAKQNGRDRVELCRAPGCLEP